MKRGTLNGYRISRVRHVMVLVAAPQGPEEFLQFLRQELAKWGKVIKSAGMKVE